MQNELDIVRDIFSSAGTRRPCLHAHGFHGDELLRAARMTRNIDVVVALAPKDTDTIVRLFTPDYYIARDAVSSSIEQEWLFNLIHQESVIKVVCIVRKSSPYRRAEFERRERITIDDFSTWIVSKEDLIISKLYWAKDSHSEQQLRDVKNLAATGCANLTTQQSASHCNHRKKCAKIPPPVIRKEIAKA